MIIIEKNLVLLWYQENEERAKVEVSANPHPSSSSPIQVSGKPKHALETEFQM